MKISIIQTITNILNEDRSINATSTRETYVLTPADGYILKNIKTGQVVKTKICLNKKIKINDYIEIKDPNALI